MSLFQGIFSKRYRDPHELAVYQDLVISEKSAADSISWAKKHIEELEKFSTLMISFIGLNPVAKNNLAIRQFLILSTLYFVLDPTKNREKAKNLKQKADEFFKNLTHEFIYAEGYSYFLYVESAYDFYWFHVGQYLFGNVSKGTLIEIHKHFGNIASPSRQVPFGDYRGEQIRDIYISHVPKTASYNRFETSNFSIWRNTDQKQPENSVYIFVNKSEVFENMKWNGHVNNEYGNICVYAHNDWVLNFQFYTGWGDKQKNLKEPYGHLFNVPMDELFDREPLWRKIKRTIKTETSIGDVLQLNKSQIKRCVIFDPDDEKITITDVGGDFSFYNLGPSFPKIVWSINPGCGAVMKDNQLKLTGRTRILNIWLRGQQ